MSIFDRAKQFVMERGRSLEIARWRFHFEGAPADEVVRELAAYQNTDGGFGHALEPDLRSPESSALATTIAFQVLRQIGTFRGAYASAAAVRMVSGAVRYFVDTMDREQRTWRIIPKSAANHPHAPWWNQTGSESALEGFSLNPTAEILGCLIDGGSLSDSGESGMANETVMTDADFASLSERILDSVTRAGTIEMHDFLCCKRLAETTGLSEAYRRPLMAALFRLLETTVALEPSDWAGYGLRPIQVAERPDSPFYPAVQDAVPVNLNYEIETQDENGGWSPTWSWGETAWPDAWKASKLEWSGWITVEKILALRRYGRIVA